MPQFSVAVYGLRNATAKSADPWSITALAGPVALTLSATRAAQGDAGYSFSNLNSM